MDSFFYQDFYKTQMFVFYFHFQSAM